MKKFLLSLINLLLLFSCPFAFGDAIIGPSPSEMFLYAVFYFIELLIIIGVTIGLIYLIIRLINRVLSKKKNINERKSDTNEEENI